MLKKAFVSLAIAGLSSAALADLPEFYLGAAGGLSDFNVSGFENGMSTSVTLGLKVHQYWALEASYITLGDFEDDTDPVWTYTYEGNNYALVLTLPVKDNIEVMAKYGLYDWERTLEQAGFGELEVIDGKNTSLGLGVSTAISDSFHLVLEYQSFDVKDEPITNASLGARFVF